jgi:hypothetical protein
MYIKQHLEQIYGTATYICPLNQHHLVPFMSPKQETCRAAICRSRRPPLHESLQLRATVMRSNICLPRDALSYNSRAFRRVIITTATL